MKKVFFLLNSLAEFDFQALIARYLQDVRVTVGESLPSMPADYDLIVLWNYRKILTELPTPNNVILFHSSDLPEGRGWAPIYHSIADEHAYYTVTGLVAAAEVDTGDMLVKARFRLRSHYTASCLRRWDSEISVLLIREILARNDGRALQGQKQTESGTFHLRRRPEDNEVPLDVPLGGLVPHLRACERHHPAFFFWNGTKYFLYVEPELPEEFPPDLEFAFLSKDADIHYLPLTKGGR